MGTEGGDLIGGCPSLSSRAFDDACQFGTTGRFRCGRVIPFQITHEPHRCGFVTVVLRGVAFVDSLGL